jgi:quinol monooxygenase YgiN
MRFAVNLPPAESLFGRLPRACAVALALAIGAAIAMPAAQAEDGYVYAVTYLDVAASSVAQGIDLIAKYREAGRHETGNVEFTALQEIARPNRFVIMEGWRDKASFEAHDKAASKARFQDALMAIRNSPPDRHVLQAFAPGPIAAAPAAGALYMVEHVDFMPTFRTTAPALVKALAESTQKEPGLVRYDVYQQPAPRTNHYEVVAAWPNRAAFDAHEAAAYTRQFRSATVMPGRANLYDQRLYKAL